MVEAAAIIGCIVLGALAAFQIALILGAPLGRFAWGGSHTVLPTKLRLASGSSLVLYGLFAGVLLAKAGLVDIATNARIIDVALWVMTLYFVVGIGMNGISRSKPERLLMTPVAALLATVYFLVATQ